MKDVCFHFDTGARRALLRLLDTCVVCMHRQARPGRTSCQVCADQHAEFLRRQRQQRIDLGLCVKCGRRPADDGKQMCPVCAEKNAARSKARRKRLSTPDR